MRRFAGNDRLIHNEITSAAVDGPENETFVESGVEPSSPTDLEIEIASGDVFIEGEPVSVSSQTETVTDVSGDVDESAYCYHTLSVDATGTLVVNTSPTGEFDPETPSEPPITQVTEPTHPAGNCFIGTAFQVNDRIERVYDGRYIIGELPNSIITQGEGSGLTAEFVEPQGEGSGLDADVRRGLDFDSEYPPLFGDGSDGVIASGTYSGVVNADAIDLAESDEISVGSDGWVVFLVRGNARIDGTINADGVGGSGGDGDDPSSSGGTSGEDGQAGWLFPTQAGGSGGTGDGDGGDGGDGDLGVIPSNELLKTGDIASILGNMKTHPSGCGAGGGSGGGNNNNSGGDGQDGQFPGGGGAATDSGGRSGTSQGSLGGAGGNGGGLVIIRANKIEGGGTITAAGENGKDGDTATDNGGGGGGGGGSGGFIGLFANTLDESITTNTPSGVGGDGFDDGSFSGGDGANGQSGSTVRVSHQ